LKISKVVSKTKTQKTINSTKSFIFEILFVFSLIVTKERVLPSWKNCLWRTRSRAAWKTTFHSKTPRGFAV